VALALAARLLTAWLSFRPVVVVDMPLLFETGFNRLTRPVIVVACGRDTQGARLVARDGATDAQAAARIDAQWPTARKTALADIVLDNDGGREALAAQVAAAAAAVKRRAALWGALTSPAGLLLGAPLLVRHLVRAALASAARRRRPG
jgi:dephospho-CoA kinase